MSIRMPEHKPDATHPGATEEEVDVALGTIAENDEKRKGHLTAIVGGVAAAGVLIGGGFVGHNLMGSDEAPNPSKGDKNAVAVDGNVSPELAYPSLDKEFGVYNLDPQTGTFAPSIADLIAEKDFTNNVVISEAEADRLTQTPQDMADSDDFEAIDMQNKFFNDRVKTLNWVVNFANANNPEAVSSRANNPEVDEEQRLLLQNPDNDFVTDTVDKLGYASDDGAPPAIPYSLATELLKHTPNDPSLLGTVCPFSVTGEKAPEICEEAQADSEAKNAQQFSKYSIFTVPDQESVPEGTEIKAEDPDGRKTLMGMTDLGVVWSNAAGEMVDYTSIKNVPVTLITYKSLEDGKTRAYLEGGVLYNEAGDY